MEKALKLIQSCLLWLKGLAERLWRALPLNHGVKLPDIVDPDEDLARYIVGSSKRAKIRRDLYDPETLEVNPSRFLDERNPRELSVDRISTVTGDEAHVMGLQFKEETNPKRTYHGYAQIKVQTCLDAGCTEVVKDDISGTKPYHANIFYPEKEKFEELEIANTLALKADLKKYSS